VPMLFRQRIGTALAALALLVPSSTFATPTALYGVSCAFPGALNVTGPDATGNNFICDSGTITWKYPAYQFGSTSATCNSTNAGVVQWTGSAFQGCNGSAWTTLDSGNILLGTTTASANPQRSGDATTGLLSLTPTTVNIETGGNVALTVTGTGAVGIGTTTPAQALDIGSGALKSGVFEFSGTPKPFALPITFGSDTPPAFMYIDSTYSVFRIGSQGASGPTNFVIDLPSGGSYQDILGLNINTLAPAPGADNTIALGLSGQRWHSFWVGTGNSIFEGSVGIGTATPRTGVALDIAALTTSELLPVGTTGQRPSGIEGMVRYNSTTHAFEGYSGSTPAWGSLATGSSVALSGLTPATGTNSIDNVTYGQTWTWNTLTTQTALTLSSSSETTGSLLALTNSGTSGTGKVLSASTATTGAGAAVAGSITGSANVGYGVYANNASTSGWALYATGGAPSYLAGSVGIGTAAPNATLQVSGNSILANNTGINVDSYALSTVAGSVNTAGGWTAVGAVGGNGGTGGSWGIGAVVNTLYMGFENGSTSNTMQTFLEVTGSRNVLLVPFSGSVGIGTTSPQATLDVNGFARLALNSSAPATCGSGNEGAVALTHLAQVCVCDTTSAWHILNTGTACSW
jgi:hypothetical protein